MTLTCTVFVLFVSFAICLSYYVQVLIGNHVSIYLLTNNG